MAPIRKERKKKSPLSKGSSHPPTLARLRRYCGHFRAFDSPDNGWKEIGPNRTRKVYGLRSSRGAWFYEPDILMPEREPRTPKEIAALMDERPIDQLDEQAEDVFGQILARAYSGDPGAIRKFIVMVREAVETLDRLTRNRADAVKAEAGAFATWPVLLRDNPKEVEHVLRQLRSLGVGTETLTPSRPRNHIDPKSFWTDLVLRAYEVCRQNMGLAPVLRAFCRKVPKQRAQRGLWRTRIEVSFCRIPNEPEDSLVVIPDWLENCGKLSLPVNSANSDAWWQAIKICVLDYWNVYPAEYAKALRRIGDKKAPKDYEKRKRALEAVKHAFKSLVKNRQ